MLNVRFEAETQIGPVASNKENLLIDIYAGDQKL